MGATEEATGRWRWALALAGLFVLVFAVAALSAPGRLDTIDAQTRYFVAQGLYERGHPSVNAEQQHAVFDDPFGFIVFEGRDGRKYSNYRLPHSALAAVAIGLADVTDVAYETRRYFFVSFINSVSAALLAVAYALWFRQQGLSRLASVGWGIGGIFCTPNWYFATSSYDDLLGVPAVVFALLVAGWGASGTGVVELPTEPAPQAPPRRGWRRWAVGALGAVVRWPVRAYRALVEALRERRDAAERGVSNRRAYLAAIMVGLLFGLAFNCKEPLTIWIIPAYALIAAGVPRWRSKLLAGALLTFAFVPGVAFSLGYEVYKFPIKWEQPVEQTIAEMKLRAQNERWAAKEEDETRPVVAMAGVVTLSPAAGPLSTTVSAVAVVGRWPHEEVEAPGAFALLVEQLRHQEFIQKQLGGYMRPFPGTPFKGVVCLLFSPGCGMFWYCPPVLLGLGGLVYTFRGRWVFALAMALACLGFFVFIASIRFFKGDLSWGPRYLTPLFAVLWLFAPRARVWPRWLVVQLLALGVLVQLLALPVSAQRMYIQKSWFPEAAPWEAWFNLSPLTSHLLHRPIELSEILHEDGSKTLRYSLGRYATASSPVNHLPGADLNPAGVRRYHYLSTWAFWWYSLWYLDEDERPADLVKTFYLFEGLAAAGVLLLIPLWLGRARRGDPAEERGLPCALP